jgi:hypothetical protein
VSNSQDHILEVKFCFVLFTLSPSGLLGAKKIKVMTHRELRSILTDTATTDDLVELINLVIDILEEKTDNEICYSVTRKKLKTIAK